MAHPDDDLLLLACEGDPAALREIRAHLPDCEPCRGRVARLRGVLAAAAEELLASRPECPGPDELALVPPGSEDGHPHVKDCPLCREEVRMLFELESERRMGFTLEHGPFVRPELLQRGAGPALYQASGEPFEMALDDGAALAGPVADGRVRLRCAGGELRAAAEGAVPETLVLVLSDAVLEQRVRWVTSGELRIAVGRWRSVRLESAESSGTGFC